MRIYTRTLWVFFTLLLSSGAAFGQTPTADFSYNDSCQSRQITFTNNSSYSSCSTCTLAYEWDFGDGNSATTTSPKHTYNTPGSYNVKLTVNASDGKTSTLTRSVTVYPQAIVKFGPVSFCESTELAFIDSSTVNGGTSDIQSRAWVFTNGTKTRTATTAMPMVDLIPAGNWTVKLKITTKKGCVDSLVKVIVIKPKPTANYSTVSRCYDTAMTFTNQSTVPSGVTITNYEWKFSDGTTYTTKDVTNKKFATPGSYNLTLTVTASSGCQDSIKRSFAVYDRPKPDFAFKNTCIDTVMEFYDKTTYLYGPVTKWEWTFEPSKPKVTYTTKQDTIKYEYKTPGTYNVMLVATTLYGCRDTVKKTITIYALPRVKFNVNNSATKAEGCQNLNFTFTDISTAPNKIVAWKWNFNDTASKADNIVTTQNASHIFSKSGVYDVKLTVTTESGCRDSLIKKVNVYVMPEPKFSFVSNCKDSVISFTDISLTPAGTYITAYSWDFGDGSAKSDKQNPDHTFTAPGKYAVKLTLDTDLGCSVTKTDTVEIYFAPDVKFSSVGQCQRNNVFFKDESTLQGSGVLSAWSWDFGDGNTSTQQNPVYKYQNAGTFNVKLTVRSSNGCGSSLSKQITILPTPTPAFTNTTGCRGQDIAFTFSNPAAGSTYLWRFGDGGTSTDQNPVHKYTTQGVYEVVIIVTGANGCSDTSQKVPVEIYPVPKADFQFTNICNDSAMTFTDASTVSGASINQWNWTFEPGKTSADKDPKHIFSKPGTYQVKLVVTTFSGCKDSITKTVVTYPKANADFTFTQSCADTAIVFTNTSTSVPGAAITGYLWDFGDGNSSTDNSPSHTYAEGAIYDVRLIAVSERGCHDTMMQKVDVFPAPKVDFYFTGKCLQNPVSFFDISTGNIESYFWEFGDGDTSNLKDPQHSFKDTGEYQVKLTATSDKGCRGSKIIPIYIEPLPDFDFIYADSCNGEAIQFTFIGSGDPNAPEPENWLWTFGDGEIKSNRNPSKTYFNPGLYEVKLTVRSKDKCESTVTKNVRIFGPPTPDFIASEACEGETTVFTDSSKTEFGTIVAWDWKFGDGKSSTSSSPQHLYKKAGTYSVKLTVVSEQGCVDSVKKNIDVLLRPVADFDIVKNPVTILKPTAEFINKSVGADSLIWFFGDGYSSSELNPTHSYADTGKYPVYLIIFNSNGCQDTLVDTMIVRQDYVIYVPNIITSNGDSLNDYFLPKGDGISDFEMIIYDRWGNEVFRSKDLNEPWKGTYSNGPERVPEGTYMYVITIIDYGNDEIKRIAGNVTVIR
ncbi:MAG: PKD domain-containing protein [Bacteroidota bacterium]|nr:PKD domain-containing protein [Bacteroidota bacterium]